MNSAGLVRYFLPERAAGRSPERPKYTSDNCAFIVVASNFGVAKIISKNPLKMLDHVS